MFFEQSRDLKWQSGFVNIKSHWLFSVFGVIVEANDRTWGFCCGLLWVKNGETLLFYLKGSYFFCCWDMSIESTSLWLKRCFWTCSLRSNWWQASSKSVNNLWNIPRVMCLVDKPINSRYNVVYMYAFFTCCSHLWNWYIKKCFTNDIKVNF